MHSLPLPVFLCATFLLLVSPQLHSNPYPADIAAWDDATKTQQRAAGRQMLQRVTEQAAQGARRIEIPKGDYRFNDATEERRPAHIVWEGLKDVTLDFHGSTLWFETAHSGFVLRNCSNVTLKNVFLDWDPLPFLQGVITAIHPKEDVLDVRLDAGYERVTPAMGPEQTKRARWRGLALDRTTREIKPGQVGFAVDFSWERNADGSYPVKFRGFYDIRLSDSGLEAGDPVVLLARMGRAVRLEDADDCTLEDVTLYSSPFVGFVVHRGSRTTFRRCNILRRPDTNRLLAGNADGIHCANMRRGPLIENCVMETLGDDFVNIHNHFSRVLWQEKPDQIIVSMVGTRQQIDELLTLEIFERATMKPLGVRRTVRAEYIPEWKIEKERCLADLKRKWHTGAGAALDYGKTVPVHRLVLDEPLPLEGDVILFPQEFASAGAVLRNNRFKGALAKGIRLQSPEALIENNDVSITGGPALTMFGQPSFWGEGPYVHSTKVVGNRFADSCLHEGSKGERAAIVIRQGDYKQHHLPHDIVIHDNTIVRPGGSGIVARGVDRLEIKGNKIEDYGDRLPFEDGDGKVPAGAGHALVVDSSDAVVLDNNQFKRPGPNAKGEVFTQDVNAWE